MNDVRVEFDENHGIFVAKKGSTEVPIDGQTASAIALFQILEQVGQMNRAIATFAGNFQKGDQSWRSR